MEHLREAASKIQLALHPYEPFLRNTRNMTGINVEKLFCFVKYKTQVKIKFKTFY